MDDVVEELKRKRLEALKQNYSHIQRQASERQQAEAEAGQQMEALEEAVKGHFSKEALQRYGTLKLAHPETAARIIVALAQLIESGRLKGMLSDEQLKELLQQLSRLLNTGKESKIVRK